MEADQAKPTYFSLFSAEQLRNHLLVESLDAFLRSLCSFLSIFPQHLTNTLHILPVSLNFELSEGKNDDSHFWILRTIVP